MILQEFFILEGLSQHLHTLSIDLFLSGAHLAPPTFSKNYCYIGTYKPLHLSPIWMFQSSFTSLDYSKIRQSFREISSLFQPSWPTSWPPCKTHPNPPVQDVENGGGLTSARWTLEKRARWGYQSQIVRISYFSNPSEMEKNNRGEHHHDY